MDLYVRAFWLPKAGNSADEYEDAFDYSLAERRFAIADGATESSFAKRWARSLVQGFTDSPGFLSVHPGNSRAELWQEGSFVGRWARSLVRRISDSPRFLSAPHRDFCRELQKWLEPLQQSWRESIEWETLQWFSLAKAQAGAFSSLLGLIFVEGELPRVERETSRVKRQTSSVKRETCKCWRWQAVAIGDSCLFQVSNGKISTAFPIEHAGQFDNRPFLLSSIPSSNQRVWGEVRFNVGDCQYDDLFILATDALAEWILIQYESGAKPWATLCDLSMEGDFASFITDLRQRGSIRNDDVTLLIVRLDPGDSRSEQPPGPLF
jgi:hypothetical protein